MVLKSAEGASLTLVRLAELCAEACLPEDVLNVVTGTGAVVGEALGQATEAEAMSSSTQLKKTLALLIPPPQKVGVLKRVARGYCEKRVVTIYHQQSLVA